MKWKNYPLFILPLLLIAIYFFPWYILRDTTGYFMGFRRLEDVDKTKYQYLKKIADNPIFKRRETDFFVSYIDLVSKVDTKNGNIYVSFQDLSSPCLDYVVYHELGHLQEGTGLDQIKADYFAVLILGQERTHHCLEETFNRLKFKMEWSDRLNLYSRLFAVSNRFTSEQEVEEYLKNKLLKE